MGMKTFGIDFTSAPSRKKPLTCAEGELRGERLIIRNISLFTHFEGLELLLESDGPWIAALDFPFGQPRQLLENLGWPLVWEEYVGLVAGMGKHAFENTLLEYIKKQPAGKKHHFRPTDKRTKSSSPMKLNYTPVGKMFFQGAPRLLKANVSVMPCRPNNSGKIAVEGYPAMIARRFSNGSYKSETKKQWNGERRERRKRILAGIVSDRFREEFGFTVDLSALDKEALLADGSGDLLDAILCLPQAAWAWTQREKNFGVPSGCDPNEGWIIDPAIF